jgi:hypothetical protein
MGRSLSHGLSISTMPLLRHNQGILVGNSYHSCIWNHVPQKLLQGRTSSDSQCNDRRGKSPSNLAASSAASPTLHPLGPYLLPQPLHQTLPPSRTSSRLPRLPYTSIPLPAHPLVVPYNPLLPAHPCNTPATTSSTPPPLSPDFA